jgi:hypothetical protein
VLPESISLEKLKHIRDEISTRRGTYGKMPVTPAASSSAQTSNPVVQRQREVIRLYIDVIPMSVNMAV